MPRKPIPRPPSVSPRTPPPPREALIAHVAEVQRSIRSCAGCGLCCTDAHNAVAIPPLEARRIANWLGTLAAERRAELVRRLGRAIARYRLKRGVLARYTCPFLEKDLRCAIPPSIKPVACLAFNPITPDRCDQEPAWFERAFAPIRRRGARLRISTEPSPIPVAVKDALKE